MLTASPEHAGAALPSQPHTGFLLLSSSCGQARGEDTGTRCADLFPGPKGIFCILAQACVSHPPLE